MNTKKILLIGTAAWIGYMLYSKVKGDQRIKELQARVADSEAKLKQLLESFQKTIVAMPTQGTASPDFSKDAAIFPAGISQPYNTCKGVTVAPPPVKIIAYPTT
jgi:hypothetical protein